MRVSPYMNINRIEFIVTYQCSSKCAHCSLGDKLDHRHGQKCVSIAESAEVVKQIAKMFDIISIMTFGGEPLLYHEAVCAIHEKARECDIQARQLITNGFFTRDDELCKQVAYSLTNSGVNKLLLSVDAFHQATIPFEYVYSFAKYSKESGIDDIKLHPAWVVNSGHDNNYNASTKEILAKFEDLEIGVSKGNNIFMAGNAAKNLSEYYDAPALDLRQTCGSMPYTSLLTEVTSLSIAPNGDVMICDFVIGNIYSEDIYDIVVRYDPYEDECMSAVMMGGCSGLIELARERGIEIDYSSCYSVCDLCRKIQGMCKSL